MLDVITIGDGLVTMQPKAKGPLRFVHEFERKIGGAELNFAIGCARLGLHPGWISNLGKDEFGRYISNYARGEGIDISHVKLMNGYPTSLNFKEVMEDGSSRTFYYRDNSATLTMDANDLDETYFQQASLLHISGVFPSIHDHNIDLINKAIHLAKNNRIPISFDPNIRLKMWNKAKAKDVLTSFLPYTDILLTGKEEAALLLDKDNVTDMVSAFQEYGIHEIAIKMGENGALAVSGNEQLQRKPPLTTAVDTVGAGDGFDAAYIYGWLKQWSLEKRLVFANTVGSMVVNVMGDNEGLPYFEDVLEKIGEREKVER